MDIADHLPPYEETTAYNTEPDSINDSGAPTISGPSRAQDGKGGFDMGSNSRSANKQPTQSHRAAQSSNADDYPGNISSQPQTTGKASRREDDQRNKETETPSISRSDTDRSQRDVNADHQPYPDLSPGFSDGKLPTPEHWKIEDRLMNARPS